MSTFILSSSGRVMPSVSSSIAAKMCSDEISGFSPDVARACASATID